MIILLMVLALICFGVMDELAHHYDSIKIPFIKNNPKFWNKRVSWKNKYTPVDYDNGLRVYEERFWGSSRWFVFLTDGWHLIQFISYQFLALAVTLAYTDQMWVALLLSLPMHLAMSTIKAVTMKVV